jgi:hypothetical protein
MDVIDKRHAEDKRRKKEEKRRKIKEERKNRLKEKANQQAIAKGSVAKTENSKSEQKHKETIIERKMNEANVEQLDDEVLS